MKTLKCAVVGAPVEAGVGQRGCLMGPDSFRTAGLLDIIQALGHSVHDRGDITPKLRQVGGHENAAVRNLSEIAGWAEALEEAAHEAAKEVDFPIFLGGDHSISIGTVPGVSRYSADLGRPQFVLWLDAHPDMNTLASTNSGNLHGTPVAYFLGLDGFEDAYPPLRAAVDPANICILGVRSVDEAESALIHAHSIDVHDMRAIDENGIQAPLANFLERVGRSNGRLHVSLDVDFLDPNIAPAVSTTVPGGATFREAHLIMEMLHDSGLATSLELVELNPFLDDRGRTARLMVDLCASLLGRKVLDRPTVRF